MRKTVYLAIGVAVMLGIYILPAPPPVGEAELTLEGKACLAVLAFAVVLCVSEALPFAVTSLFVLLLIPAFGVEDYAVVMRTGFGNPIITFFLGVLLLSAAFSRSGLGRRLALNILRRVGTRTDRVLLGFLVVGAALSMRITDIAVAAILLPLGVGVLQDAELKPLESNFGRALMIACAFGPLIGGIATPAGTGHAYQQHHDHPERTKTPSCWRRTRKPMAPAPSSYVSFMTRSTDWASRATRCSN